MGKAPEPAPRPVEEVRMKGCTGILHAPDGVFFAAAAFCTANGKRRTAKCSRCVAAEGEQRRKSAKRLKGAGGSSSVPPAVHEGGTPADVSQPMELISPSQALRARFIGNKQLQSGQPTPFKLDLTDAQKTLLDMAMECLVDMSSKQWNEMGFGIQGGRIQVHPPPPKNMMPCCCRCPPWHDVCVPLTPTGHPAPGRPGRCRPHAGEAV